MVLRILVAGLCGVGMVASAEAAIVHGHFLHGNQSGGGAWSYGHRATSNAMSPTGNWTQFAGGTAIVAIDPDAYFVYQYVDNGSAGLSAGDQLVIDISVPVRSYSGNIFATPTLGSVVGTVDFDGYFTVGGPSASAHTHGLGGSGIAGTGYLDYELSFTSPVDSFGIGDVIAGRLFAQAAGLTSQFNGISLSGTTMRWSIWGDNRPPSPNFFSSTNSDTSIQNPMGTYSPADGTAPVSNYPFGWDLVVESEVGGDRPNSSGVLSTPEPTSYIAWALLMGCVVVGYRLKRKG